LTFLSFPFTIFHLLGLGRCTPLRRRVGVGDGYIDDGYIGDRNCDAAGKLELE
jgi:hypothetical protein|tara:strand:- start:7115 stop:7273 length:159 start_codon:yes stop_codon:yes gene_type:complete